MLNLSIVEDHAALRESLVEVLAAEGHHVSAFDSAESFLANCSVASLQIVVLDLNLPGEDGVSLARRLRSAWPQIGIIMLTARASPEARKIGYLEGADIYLAKPGSAEELTASVQALARRLKPPEQRGADLELDVQRMSLLGRAGRVALTAADVTLLQAFLAAPENKLSSMAIARLTGLDGSSSKGAVGVKIVRLRKKMLLAGTTGQPISVVRNEGFKLTVLLDQNSGSDNSPKQARSK